MVSVILKQRVTGRYFHKSTRQSSEHTQQVGFYKFIQTILEGECEEIEMIALKVFHHMLQT